MKHNGITRLSNGGRRRAYSAISLALTAGVIALCGAARADNRDVVTVMEMVPADTPVVVIIADGQRLDQSVAALAKQVWPDGTTSSLMLQIKEDIPLGDWVDLAAPMALGATRLGETDQRVVWARVPGFVTKVAEVEGAKEESGIWHLPLDGTHGVYVKVDGDYLAASPSREYLEAVTEPGRSLADEMKPRADLVSGRDVLIHLNVEAMRERALAGLAQAAELIPMLTMLAAQQGTGADPAVMPAVFQSFFEAAKQLLEQLAYVDVTLAVTSASADITVATGYGDGVIKSYLAKQKPAAVGPFTHVEDQPYLIALSYHGPGSDAPFFSYLVKQLGDALGKASATKATDTAVNGGTSAPATADSAAEAVKLAIELYRTLDGVDMVGAMSPDGMQSTGAYLTADAEGLLELVKKSFSMDNPLLTEFQGLTLYKSLGPRRIGSVTVEEFSMKMRPGLAKLLRMPGEEIRFALGVAGKAVRFSAGTAGYTERAFHRTVGQPLASSPHVKKALKALPKKRTAVILFDPAGVVPLLGTMRNGPSVAPMAPGPPIAVSVSLTGEPARLDLHLPVRALERLARIMSPGKPDKSTPQEPAKNQ